MDTYIGYGTHHFGYLSNRGSVMSPEEIDCAIDRAIDTIWQARLLSRSERLRDVKILERARALGFGSARTVLVRYGFAPRLQRQWARAKRGRRGPQLARPARANKTWDRYECRIADPIFKIGSLWRAAMRPMAAAVHAAMAAKGTRWAYLGALEVIPTI